MSGTGDHVTDAAVEEDEEEHVVENEHEGIEEGGTVVLLEVFGEERMLFHFRTLLNDFQKQRRVDAFGFHLLGRLRHQIVFGPTEDGELEGEARGRGLGVLFVLHLTVHKIVVNEFDLKKNGCEEEGGGI